MGPASTIPLQTMAVIKHYYVGSRERDLVFIELEFCLADGMEDDWTDNLNKAIAPLMRFV